MIVALLTLAFAMPAAPASPVRLFTWERGVGFEVPALPGMRMYLRFYEWNLFEARQPGRHTNGNDRLPGKVAANQTQAEVGTEDLRLTATAAADGADLTLVVTNRTDYEWPSLAAIIPCFNPGPADARNPRFANTNTWFHGPGGLQRLEKREIHFSRALETNLRGISPELRFVFSGKWPTASAGAASGIVIRESGDGEWVTGIAWEDFLSVQAHNPWECMHLAVRVGPLKPGQRKTTRGKVYLFRGKKEDCFQRYLRDFPRARIVVRPNRRLGRIDPNICGHSRVLPGALI